MHFLHAGTPTLFGVARGSDATKWNVLADSLDGIFLHPGGVGGDVALSGDEHHLISRNDNGLRVTDLRTEETWFATGTIEPGMLPPCRFSPDRQTIVVAKPHENAGWVVEFATRRVCEVTFGSPRAVANDSQLVAAGSGAASILLIEPQSGRTLFTLRHSTSVDHAAAFSPDGKILATSTIDGSVVLWHTATGEKVARFETGAIRIVKLRFSHDRRRLAAVGTQEADPDVPNPDGAIPTARIFVWSGVGAR